MCRFVHFLLCLMLITLSLSCLFMYYLQTINIALVLLSNTKQLLTGYVTGKASVI